jgi:hypothetical protein
LILSLLDLSRLPRDQLREGLSSCAFVVTALNGLEPISEQRALLPRALSDPRPQSDIRLVRDVVDQDRRLDDRPRMNPRCTRRRPRQSVEQSAVMGARVRNQAERRDPPNVVES